MAPAGQTVKSPGVGVGAVSGGVCQLAASSVLTRENERRWRIFRQRLDQIASG